MPLPANVSPGDPDHDTHHDALHVFYNQYEETTTPVIGAVKAWDGTNWKAKVISEPYTYLAKDDGTDETLLIQAVIDAAAAAALPGRPVQWHLLGQAGVRTRVHPNSSTIRCALALKAWTECISPSGGIKRLAPDATEAALLGYQAGAWQNSNAGLVMNWDLSPAAPYDRGIRWLGRVNGRAYDVIRGNTATRLAAPFAVTVAAPTGTGSGRQAVITASAGTPFSTTQAEMVIEFTTGANATDANKQRHMYPIKSVTSSTVVVIRIPPGFADPLTTAGQQCCVHNTPAANNIKFMRAINPIVLPGSVIVDHLGTNSSPPGETFGVDFTSCFNAEDYSDVIFTLEGLSGTNKSANSTTGYRQSGRSLDAMFTGATIWKCRHVVVDVISMGSGTREAAAEESDDVYYAPGCLLGADPNGFGDPTGNYDHVRSIAERGIGVAHGDRGGRVIVDAQIAGVPGFGVSISGGSKTLGTAAPGTWSAATTYAKGTVVVSAAQHYVSLQASNLNHAVTDTAWWEPINLNQAVFISGAGWTDSLTSQAGAPYSYPDQTVWIELASGVLQQRTVKYAGGDWLTLTAAHSGVAGDKLCLDPGETIIGPSATIINNGGVGVGWATNATDSIIRRVFGQRTLVRAGARVTGNSTDFDEGVRHTDTVRVVKSVDQARVNTTTAAADDELRWNAPAGSIWEFTARLYVACAVDTADMKVQVGRSAAGSPLAATARYGVVAAQSTVTSTGVAQGTWESAGAFNTARTVGLTSVDLTVEVTGTVTMGSSPAEIQIQWAQNTLDATNDVIVRAGSSLVATRVA